MEENTVLYLTEIVLNAIREVQRFRDELKDHEYNHHKIFWTMDNANFIEPLKRVIDLIPEQIRLNQSADLNDRLYDLSRVLLRELDHAREIEDYRSNEKEILENFRFIRGKLV